jgi:hypothetical protein
MYSADTLPNWHGGNQCILQTLCPVDTALIVVSCILFSATTVYWRLPAEPLRRCHGRHRRLLQTLPRHLSESSATTLLPDLSPVTPLDFLHDYHKLVNVYCRLGAMLQPARQCLLQTFCCSSRHRYFLQIYLSYCHSTKQCILQALHTAATTHPDEHGAHTAFLPWRSSLSPSFSKLLLSFPPTGCALRSHGRKLCRLFTLWLHGQPIAVKSSGWVQGLRLHQMTCLLKEGVCYDLRVL